MTEDIQLRLTPEQAATPALLEKMVKAAYRGKDKINAFRVIRRSVDARKRQVTVNVTVRIATGEDKEVAPDFRPMEFRPVAPDAPVMIIVGAGPAGLFGALQALREGIRPVVVERGKDVDSRRLDIAEISRGKRINPVSNYCFGEGGAGAYSDGKLFTRSKKRGNVREVFELFVQHGASENILIDAHPHIGSDKLPHVIRNIRNTINENGGEVRFETCMTGLLTEDGKVRGITTDKGDLRGDAVLLAIGHSARDTVRRLHAQRLPLEAKGIAMGVRLEHPQHLIDRIQYHSPKGRGKWLPAAEYSFVTQSGGRGVYSFCMCPGGVVVPAGSAEGELVVNGMSASARSGRLANSGMVVELHPGDIPDYEQFMELEMLTMQEDLEHRMFESGDGTIIAPAQRMTDFIEGKVSLDLPATSYAPGVRIADFNELLPDFIATRLREGFLDFGRKAQGFLSPEATMIGLESRTSSPVRMVRDAEMLSSAGMPNVYPAGEGAGYAGGIVSAAIDGMRCVRAFASGLKPESGCKLPIE